MRALVKQLRDDPVLSKIIEVSQNNPNLPDNSYCVVNGAFYHVSDAIKFDNTLQKDVLTQAHSGFFAGGHTGIDNTYDKLRKRFFWVIMYRSAVNTVSNCLLCQARRMQNPRVPIQDMPNPEHPFQMVGIDTCGPFYSNNSCPRTIRSDNGTEFCNEIVTLFYL